MLKQHKPEGGERDEYFTSYERRGEKTESRGRSSGKNKLWVTQGGGGEKSRGRGLKCWNIEYGPTAGSGGKVEEARD